VVVVVDVVVRGTELDDVVGANRVVLVFLTIVVVVRRRRIVVVLVVLLAGSGAEVDVVVTPTA
jgi:hypothetical protein